MSQANDRLLAHEYRLAQSVRTACLEAALHAYEAARMDGLCHEGAWECAIDALRSLDLAALLAKQPAPDD